MESEERGLVWAGVLEQIRKVNAPETRERILSVILLSHRVPWGTNWPQWDTEGRLSLWVNRQEFWDAFSSKVKRGVNPVETWSGVPVVNVEHNSELSS